MKELQKVSPPKTNADKAEWDDDARQRLADRKSQPTSEIPNSDTKPSVIETSDSRIRQIVNWVKQRI